MSTAYIQKQSPAQKKDASSASSILDASSQSESLQRKADMANSAAQREEAPRPNNTGMPDNLKSGIESLSGFSMDDVRVHYNSSKPATVQALAYTQGTDIHVAPGQEKHLPHEAWHVAQQMAGRVSPTTNINGMPVNDNAGLEHEADVMGEKAASIQEKRCTLSSKEILSSRIKQNKMLTKIVQRIYLQNNETFINNFMTNTYSYDHYVGNNGHFNAIYIPFSNRLYITLPVFFNSSINKAQKSFFINNIKETWSDKYHIVFYNGRLNPEPSRKKRNSGSSNNSWSTALSKAINIFVNVFPTKIKKRAFFELGSTKGGSFVQGRLVKLRANSFVKESSSSIYPTLNPTAHEVGHMFGLGDEYVVKGKKRGARTTHYWLTHKAFGKLFAKKHARMRNKIPKVGSSIMRNSDTVKIRHYVTFWDAMVKAIQHVYGKTSSEKAPNMHEDWKITKK